MGPLKIIYLMISFDDSSKREFFGIYRIPFIAFSIYFIIGFVKSLLLRDSSLGSEIPFLIIKFFSCRLLMHWVLIFKIDTASAWKCPHFLTLRSC